MPPKRRPKRRRLPSAARAPARKSTAASSKSTTTTSWDDQYQRLILYKQAHDGDTKVPRSYKEDPELAKWVHQQRAHHRNGKLSSGHKTLLDEVDFDWGVGKQEASSKSWDDQYQSLILYKQAHDGDTKVPRSYKEDPELAKWVHQQRANHRNGKLDSGHKTLLDDVDFDWGLGKQEAWDGMFDKLVEYKNQNLHTCVPRHYKEDPRLGGWVSHQRKEHRSGRLSEARKLRLEELGFEWEVGACHLGAPWYNMLKQLLNFKALNGHTRIPKTYGQDPRLANWAQHQREHRQDLSADRQALLDEADFDWNVGPQETILPHEAEMETPQEETVPSDQTPATVSGDVAALLEAAGVEPVSMDTNEAPVEAELAQATTSSHFRKNAEPWDALYSRLCIFKETHGHTRVVRSYKPDPKLGNWVQHQRGYHKNGKLSAARTALLDAIDFDWNVRGGGATSEQQLVAKRARVQEESTAMPLDPSSITQVDTAAEAQMQVINQEGGDSTSNSVAAAAVTTELQAAEVSPEEAVPPDPTSNLDTLVNAAGEAEESTPDDAIPQVDSTSNPVSEAAEAAESTPPPESAPKKKRKRGGVPPLPWDTMYTRLLQYKEKHGHTLVPRDCKEDPKLGRWVQNQRYFKYRRTPEQIAMLNEAGFVWESGYHNVRNQDRWLTIYEKLKEYKLAHGNARVPRNYKADRKLAQWVDTQRKAYRKGRLSEQRKTLLNDVGFEWKVHDSFNQPWDEMLHRLMEYKKTHGDTRVPKNYPQDPKLGSWVNKHRVEYESGKLSEDRKALLNTIGFEWNVAGETTGQSTGTAV